MGIDPLGGALRLMTSNFLSPRGTPNGANPKLASVRRHRGHTRAPEPRFPSTNAPMRWARDNRGIGALIADAWRNPQCGQRLLGNDLTGFRWSPMSNVSGETSVQLQRTPAIRSGPLVIVQKPQSEVPTGPVNQFYCRTKDNSAVG